MDRVFSLVGDIRNPQTGVGDAFVDRLSCQTTVVLLVVFACLVTANNYIGTPVSCWCPPHFTESMVEFTNKVCWTTNTYFLPIEQYRLPKDGPEKEAGRIGYYQWVALILVFQAGLFYLPRPLWGVLSKRSGISVHSITDAAIEYQKKQDQEDRDKCMRYMVKHMGRFLLDLSRNCLMANRVKRFWLNLYGNYLLMAYFFIKFVYLANIMLQIHLLNRFLGMDYHMYGFQVLAKMFQGQQWTTSDRFPRVTICDFKIRVVGNIHPYTVQCSLPMNLFNEIVFIFVWFWMFFVGLATLASIGVWAASVYMPRHVKEVQRRLIAVDKIKPTDTKKQLAKFVINYMRRDGCFIMTMVTKNSSDMVTAELLGGLWEHYKENINRIEKLSSRDCRMLDVDETHILNQLSNESHVHSESHVITENHVLNEKEAAEKA